MNRLDGAAKVDLGGGRFADFSKAVRLRDGDYTGDIFTAEVRLFPNAPGVPLATMAVNAPALAGDDTVMTLAIPKAVMEAMPQGPEADSDAVLYWDMKRTTGGVTSVLFFGDFTVYAGVTRA